MILNAVVLALVDLFDTAVSATVYDGPVPTSVNESSFVLVGSTGDDDDGAFVETELSTLGDGTWIDEAGEVVCSAWSWSGGTDLAAHRVIAGGLAADCAAAVAADRTLGGLLVAPGLAQVSAFQYQPRQTTEGAICRFTFSVTYRHVNT